MYMSIPPLHRRSTKLQVLDETLSFGVLGATGQGLCEHLGLASSRVDALLGSLEHAVSTVGGFCAGRRTLVDHQRLAGQWSEEVRGLSEWLKTCEMW